MCKLEQYLRGALHWNDITINYARVHKYLAIYNRERIYDYGFTQKDIDIFMGEKLVEMSQVEDYLRNNRKWENNQIENVKILGGFHERTLHILKVRGFNDWDIQEFFKNTQSEKGRFKKGGIIPRPTMPDRKFVNHSGMEMGEPTFDQSITEPKQCSCDIKHLMWFGCKCGGV